MVPKNRPTTLGEVAHITKLAGFEYTKHFDYSIGGEVIALRSLNIRNGNLDLSEIQTIPKEVSNALPRSQLKSGDIVLGYVGSKLGNLAKIEQDNRFHLAPNVALIRPEEGVSSDYLLQYMQGPYFQSRLWAFATSTGQPALSMANIRNLPIHLYAFDDQKKITEILSTWDRAIETTEKLIANSEAQKKALMQQLLTGKKRLPGFGGAWAIKRINAISQRITRRNDGDEYPILTISSTAGFVRQDQKYSRYMAGRSVENYILLKKGEFAYNKGNSKTYEFGCVFDLQTYDEALVPHVYVCFSLKDGFSPEFYRALFEADYLRPQLRRLVNTGVRNNGLLNITPAEFLKCKVLVPPFAEQVAIAEVLVSATKELQMRQNKLMALKTEKSALMQQLLTGKRRVKIDKEVAV